VIHYVTALILSAPPAPASSPAPSPAGGGGSTGSTSGITDWLQNNVLGLVIFVLGIIVLILAKKKNLSDSLTVVAGVLLGLMVVGLSVNGNGVTVGTWISHLVFGG
jgi:hypothetical protein